MYAVAANPDRWDEIIDALDDAPAEAGASADALARIAQTAARPAGGTRVGVMLIGADGAVGACNPAAEAVYEQRLAAHEVNGRRVLDPTNSEAVVQARRKLIDGGGRQVIVKFVQADDEGPQFAYVVPVSALPADLAASLPHRAAEAPGQIAVIFPAVEMTDWLWASIRDSFGLTPAETRLAARLKEGLTLREAADDLGVSVNTVRNQLRAIFDKMGLYRQSDLVRALTQLSSLAGAVQQRDEGPQSPAALGPDRAGGQAPPALRFHRLADGRRLAYRDYGAPRGRPVLVLHQGLGSSLLPRGSDSLARDLDLRLICPERPGAGRSDPSPNYSFDGVAADLSALVRGLGLEPVQLVGVMSGAPFAFSAAQALGPLATRLLAVSARPPGDRPETEKDARHRLALFRRRIMRSPWLSDAIFTMMRLQMNRRHIVRMVRAGASSPGDGAYLASHPQVLDFLAESIGESLAVSARGVADEVKCGARHRRTAAPILDIPVAIWHGVDDPQAAVGEVMAWIGPQAREVRIFQDVGHFLPHKHWLDILGWLADR